MKFFKIGVMILFAILLGSVFCGAVEKGDIREWIREDMTKETINRLEGILKEREAQQVEAAKAEVKKLYSEARTALESEKYDESREKYEKILSLDPGEEKAKEYIAKIDKIKDLVQAREAKIEGIQKKRERETNLKDFTQEGAELYRQKRYGEAKEKWEDALKYDPDNEGLKTWINRCRVREVEEKKEEALFEKGLEEKAGFAAVDEAYLPKKKGRLKLEELEEEIITVEERKKKIEEMLEAIEISELHLRDADLRDIINKITGMTKVTILVDWTTISEASGVGARIRVPVEMPAAAEVTAPEFALPEFETPKAEAAPPPQEMVEIRTMHLDIDIYNPMPLKAFLDYLMKITRLKYRIEEHAVLISTPQALEKEDMVVKVYKLKYGMTKLRPITLKPLGEGKEE